MTIGSLIPLMFHYVRRSSRSLPHSRHYEMEAFQKLVRHLLYSECLFSTFSEYAHKPECRSNACVLTFDDGLADHYEVALFLHSQGIRATFYPISLPFLDLLVAPVHLVQYCVAKHGNDILGLFTEYCQRSCILLPQLDSIKAERFSDIYNSYDTPSEAALFKRIFNFYNIDPSTNFALRSFCTNIGIPTSPSDYYLTLDQIIQIQRMGHEIGCHGHSHRPLSLLNSNDIYLELSKSKIFFENATDTEIVSFCYPYGTESSFTDESINCLKRMGFTNACTAEPLSQIRGAECDRIYRIPRQDIANF